MVACYVPSSTTVGVAAVIILILQKGKLRLKELQQCAQGHTANKQQSQGSVRGLPHSKLRPGPLCSVMSAMNRRRRSFEQEEACWCGRGGWVQDSPRGWEVGWASYTPQGHPAALNGGPLGTSRGLWLVEEDCEFEEVSDLVCSSRANVCRSAMILGQKWIFLSLLAHLCFQDPALISYRGWCWVSFFHAFWTHVLFFGCFPVIFYYLPQLN